MKTQALILTLVGAMLLSLMGCAGMQTANTLSTGVMLKNTLNPLEGSNRTVAGRGKIEYEMRGGRPSQENLDFSRSLVGGGTLSMPWPDDAVSATLTIDDSFVSYEIFRLRGEYVNETVAPLNGSGPVVLRLYKQY